MKKIKLPEINKEQVADEIGDFIVDRVLQAGVIGGVVGLSGGVDSTTTAALAKRAFDIYNSSNPKQRLELVGYILPSSVNNPADAEDGIKVAERLGIRYEVQNIEPIVEAFRVTNPEAMGILYHRGNLISRIRANILSTKSATERKSILGTGNKDEDFRIGYYTLFGDGAVHLSPIGDLSKRLVRQMARHVKFGDFANRDPTAGLERGQTDFKDLGYTYDLVEVSSEGLEQGFENHELFKCPQVLEVAERDMELYNEKFGEFKFKDPRRAIDDILRRHYTIALPKAELVSPEIAKVTKQYN